MAEKFEFEPDPGGPRIDASVPVGLIRRAYRKGGEAEALDVARQCMSEITDEQILKIARGEATLEGCTPGPITYKETP